MLGTFDNDQPKIEIEIKGTGSKFKKMIALVDSGFNGYLTLPSANVILLGTKLLKELGKTFVLDSLNGKVEIIDSKKAL